MISVGVKSMLEALWWVRLGWTWEGTQEELQLCVGVEAVEIWNRPIDIFGDSLRIFKNCIRQQPYFIWF